MTGSTSERAALAEVLAAQERGDVLLAYDMALSALERDAGNPTQLRYQAVLALARSGATHAALDRYRQWRLQEVEDEDVGALAARILKDAARSATPLERPAQFLSAAEAYTAVYEQTGGYYPGINAATMWMLGGDRERCLDLARRVAQDVESADASNRADSYHVLATRAEAALLLGDVPRAAEAIRGAAAVGGRNLVAINATWRQLDEICSELSLRDDVLAPLAPPTIAHFCGHIEIAKDGPGHLSPPQTEELSESLAAALRRERVAIGYGALAAGSDLLFAEALLEMNAELNIVLPFTVDEFERTSVRPAGAPWVDRFRRCLGEAASVTLATSTGHTGDDTLFDFGNRVAMGLTVLRARQMNGPAIQLAAWDGNGADSPSHTFESIEYWKRTGFPSHTIEVRPRVGRSESYRVPPESHRRLCGILFTDVTGYSKLSESELHVYWDGIMPLVAKVLAVHSDDTLFRDTWGDGLHVIFENVRVAARCALDLQQLMEDTDFAALGLPGDFALRLAVHFGPVFKGHDPVVDRCHFYGTEVTRTARIEPVTPPGHVYVTEPFAAILAAETGSEFSCDYVGCLPTARSYGAFRMYHLKRARA